MSQSLINVLLSFLFCFLFSSVSADILPYDNSTEYLNRVYGDAPLQTFVSEPDIYAPIANILTAAHGSLSPSRYIIWSPAGPSLPLTRPQILDTETLSLVWEGPALDYETLGATVQTCNNTDYLTWWSGLSINSHKAGTSYIYNTNYESAFNITAQNNRNGTDAHEVTLTPQCTALVTLYEHRQYNLSQFGFPEGWLLDSYFQEIDMATNELLFEWRASDHVDVYDSVWSPEYMGQGLNEAKAFDFFHINSIEKDFHGNYLISSRHMGAIYYIDGQTGDILWTLGGARSSFTDLSGGNATNFAWQHHARWTSPNLTSLSMFDDRNTPYNHEADPRSRGMIIDLNYTSMTATLAAEYTATNNISSIREGSMQVLPDTDGNVILGYGNEPGFTEFSANGTVLWDVTFGPFGLNRESADNYRALKVNWTGAPLTTPAIAAGPAFWDGVSTNTSLAVLHALQQDTSNNTAYFSWNGATEVQNWLILASNDTVSMNMTAHYWQTVPKSGFETSLRIANTTTRYIRAVAANANATIILSASPVLDMHTGNTTVTPFDAEAATAQWAALTATKPSLLAQASAALTNLATSLHSAVTKTPSRTVVVAAVGATLVVTALSLIGLGTFLLLRWQRKHSRGFYRRQYNVDDTLDDTLDVADDDDEEYDDDEDSEGQRRRSGDLEKARASVSVYAVGEDDDTAVGSSSSEDDRSVVKFAFCDDSEDEEEGEGDLSCLTVEEGRR